MKCYISKIFSCVVMSATLSNAAFGQEQVLTEPVEGKEITDKTKIENLIYGNFDYRYIGRSHPDPFLAPLQSTFNSTETGDIEIPIVSPLQRHDVSALKLVGVWDGKTTRKSMIVTPRGEGVITVVNDPVGNKGGILYAIDKEKVTVREFNFGPDGTREFNDRVVFLEGAEPTQQGVIIIKGGGKENDKKPEEASPNVSENIEAPAGSDQNTPGIEPEKLIQPGSYSKAFGDAE